MGKEQIFTKRLLAWFSSNARNFPWRNEIDPYKILVAEKLLQQTTYGHVLKVYNSFFEKFPNVQDLAKAEISEIENTIRQLGFQRQRAKQLKKMALRLLDKHSGKIPSKKEALLELSGVGEYVSSAVLCFAFNKDEPIVDMNVRRVTKRYFSWEDKDREIQKRMKRLVPKGKGRQFNWGIIDFSALICSRKPKCNKCFLLDFCSYFNELVKSPKLV
jgi:A/G-specific adenine glycosylase